ncbi:heme o synthase [Rhodoblastus acidophilus]|uniref:Protoheme IX farnesyltransferase n=1 Tax=Candidatus Rhodoblastus alkanivorans TaxID=2954117 RepID=A0ABS9ZA96_9HYPH|nr:heme o synthase [Candidatus Rhodoblastus alkanivorans]MCI4677262.1 heme o synthase [Candidatus Rhodoblastus alkanivorans]MCI4684614.1 heme o synthase [Candidatus Rhodoblastus alkanivorans]MDI4641936.1 heme o synthase [Rhodoblastus acidophilus]
MSLVSDRSLELSASGASPSDYVALLKPRIMSLSVFTAFAGMLTAPHPINPVIGAISLLAIAVGAGASGALNMWYDSDIDRLMARTAGRPIPAGRLTRGEALAFGLVLAAFAVLTLGLAANWLAAGLLAFTIFYYVVIYTMWLKRATPHNIVIGGAAGALPPMVGYAAAAGSLSMSSLLLFTLIFVWTPPHFWSLALVKTGDYARAGVPMAPNVWGEDATRRQILLYSLLLAPIGILPWFFGFTGPTYGIAATLGGVGMVVGAVAVFRRREGTLARKTAMRNFGFSILYLFTLFAVLVVERLATFWMGA